MQEERKSLLSNILAAASQPAVPSALPIARDLDGPRAPMPATTRYKSELAAAAAQHVTDLEADINDTRVQLAAAQARIVVLEESNTILHEDRAKAEHDRDYYRDRCAVITTMLNTAADIILKAAKEPLPEPPPAKNGA